MADLKRYLDGHMSPEEEREFRNLLGEDCPDPNLDKELEDYFNSMEDNDVQLADSAYLKAEKTLGIRGLRIGRKVLRWTMNIAAVAAVFVFAFLIYDRMYLVEDVQWIEKRVEHGEIVSLLLPDGSHLYMNSGSRVTYPERFEGKTRQIFVDGEIYADIAKDPEHPFVINSGDVSVDVLGTTFNMKSFSDAECVEVILLEGSVRFNVLEDTHRNEMVMRPGNMLQYHRSSGKIDLDVFPKDKYSAFYKNRSLHFFNITLEDITEDLERLFCTRIVILNEDLAKKKYFACFGNNESLDEILNAINADKKIKIRKKEGVIYLK